MNTNFVNIIKRIIAEQGEAILGDPARLKPFIKSYAQNVPQEERRAFGRCIEAGAYTGLKNARTAAERQGVKAAFPPPGIPAAQCKEALDTLEAALFGAREPAPPGTAPPRAPLSMWAAVLILNIFGLNYLSRFITGHITTGVLFLLLYLSAVISFFVVKDFTDLVVPLILCAMIFIIWIVDLVKIAAKKWQMKDGTFLVP